MTSTVHLPEKALPRMHGLLVEQAPELIGKRGKVMFLTILHLPGTVLDGNDMAKGELALLMC